MQTVVLTEQEWQQVMGCMSFAPGRECIPLLNKIGEQLRMNKGMTAPEGFDVDNLGNKPGRMNG